MQKAEPIIKLQFQETFGFKLLSGYEDAIMEFSSAYMKLHQEEPKIFTITPKIHIVMFHVVQYLQMQIAEMDEE